MAQHRRAAVDTIVTVMIVGSILTAVMEVLVIIAGLALIVTLVEAK